MLGIFHFIFNQPPIIIIGVVVLAILCLLFYIPWRSLYYYYHISETISDLETPAEVRNAGKTKEDDLVTDDDLCETLRDLLKHYRIHTQDASKIAEVLTHIGIAMTRHGGDKEEGIEMLKESLVLRRRIFGKNKKNAKKTDEKQSTEEDKKKVTPLDYVRDVDDQDHDDDSSSDIPQGVRRRDDDYSGDHVAIAQSLNNLGLALESNGNATDGLKLQKFSLEMYQRLHDDEDHEAIATAMSNVGESIISACASGKNGNTSNEKSKNNKMEQQKYQNLHTVDEGIKLLRKSLEMRRRLYNHKSNPNHPALWRSLENLALALENFGGDIEKDEKLQEEVAELRKEAEGIHEVLLLAEKEAEYVVGSLGGNPKNKKTDEKGKMEAKKDK